MANNQNNGNIIVKVVLSCVVRGLMTGLEVELQEKAI
jgi:hypothetical protein